MHSQWLWIAITFAAIIVQTVRNTAHRMATVGLPLAAATTVRFLFAVPFALALFGAVIWWTGAAVPALSPRFLLFAAGGTLAQSAATALLVQAMRERSFVVAIALTKTEPLHVALISLLLLGETAGLGLLGSVACSILGVIVMALPAGASARDRTFVRSVAIGVASGAVYAASGVMYRGASLAVPTDNFVVAAATTLVVSLVIQTAVLTAYLAIRQRAALSAIRAAWRPSLLAGLAGASASFLWYAAGTIQSVTLISTLALTEILFANIASQKFFREVPTRRELIGMAVLMLGVGLVLNR